MAFNQQDRNQPDLTNEALWKRLEALETELKNYKDEASFLRGQLSASENSRFEASAAPTSRRRMLKKLAGGVAGIGALAAVASPFVSSNVIAAENPSANAIEATPGADGYAGRFNAGGLANVYLQPATTAGAPADDTANSYYHQQGELYVDLNGALWYCFATGTSASVPSKWRKLLDNKSLGNLTFLDSPVRVLDTELGVNNPAGVRLVGFQAVGAANAIPADMTPYTKNIQIWGMGAIPASGVAGVFGVMTIYSSDSNNYATLWKRNAPFPLADSTRGVAYASANPGTLSTVTFYCKVSTASDANPGFMCLATQRNCNAVMDVIGYYEGN